MNPQTALAAGYTLDQVLEFITNTFPAIGKRIKQAKNIGHDVESIVNQFKSIDKNQLKQLNDKLSQQPDTGFNPWMSGQRATKQSSAQTQAPIMARNALMAAGTAYGLSRLAPQAMSAMSQLGQLGLPKPGPQTDSSAVNPMQPVQPPQAMMQAAKQPGQAVPVPPLTPQGVTPTPSQATPIDPSHQFVNDMILKMKAGGEPIETIISHVKEKYPSYVSKMERASGQPFDKMLLEMFGSQKKPKKLSKLEQQFQNEYGEGPFNAQNQTNEIAANQAQENQPQGPQDQGSPIELQQQGIREEEQPAKGKGSLVTLPDGEIGTVDDLKKDHLVVDVDGKKRPIKLDQAVDIPASKEDLADLYTNLIQAIPESERSAMINMAGYDENHNELVFKPHEGAFYVYKDIPPEFADKLKKAMFNAKTTGENFYGAWSEGESSRGAGIAALIKELQKMYGGKGKEYTRKYQTIYDILALPKEAVKQKLKRERDEAKQRKKAK